MIANDKTIKDAARHLSEHDSALAGIVAKYPECSIRPHKNYYQELVDSIISQQLSVKAARSIEKRFCEMFGSNDFPAPELILGKDVEELRTAGLSRGKALYVRDLAQHVVDGKIRFDQFENLSNEEIIKELVAVKGIGEWTAHMFLMFCMGRLDILAHGDLGIKNGIRKLYDLDHAPTPEEINDIADQNNWHPYESVACWYVWQSLENVPAL